MRPKSFSADADQMRRPLVLAMFSATILTLAFAAYLSNVLPEKDAFTDIFFQDPRGLPYQMRVGEQYNVSFNFQNHGPKNKTYLLDVESHSLNMSRNVSLKPGQSASFTLAITPSDRTYELVSYVEHTAIHIVSDSDYEMRHTLLPGFSKLNRNITLEEVRSTPVSEYSIYRTVGENTTLYRLENLTFKALGDELVFESYSISMDEHIVMAPFVVSLTEYSGGKRLQIHFRHRVE